LAVSTTRKSAIQRLAVVSKRPADPQGAIDHSSSAHSKIEVLDRDEYRRGVGLCVVNKKGLVFVARSARVFMFVAASSLVHISEAA
jgi:hypothetical protein